MKARFIKSAAAYGDCIVSGFPQIAVVGKSNVGKSSFINAVTGESGLARASKDPGRTRLINFFLIDERYILTDLPGYGYAKVSQSEKKKWGELVEAYLEKEPMLAHVFFLVDIRHKPTTDDLVMYDYLFKRSIPYTVVATKSDKIAKSKIINEKRRLAAEFKIGSDDVIPVSAPTGFGRDALLRKIEQIIENVKYTEISENNGDNSDDEGI